MDDGVAMDVDDMDIDLGLDETVTAIEAEAMQFVGFCRSFRV